MVTIDLATTAAYRIVQSNAIGLWVAEQMHGSYFPQASVAIGLMRDEVIVAGVIYEHYNGRSIVCHMAALHLTPKYLASIFDYPFKVANVEKIIAPIPSSNEASIKLVKHMGFTDEARIANAHPDGDILLYTLTRQNCRFLGPSYVSRLEH